MKRRFRYALKYLFTGYFASVMATGIVSIALHTQGFEGISEGLFVVSIALYIVLLAAYVTRAVLFPRIVRHDLLSAATMFGYLTFVAATDVLGSRFALAGYSSIAAALGIVGLAAWVANVYFDFAVLIICNSLPIQKVISGSWLIVTVSTESLVVLGSTLAHFLPEARSLLLFLSYVYWGIGFFIYLVFIVFIVYRFAFVSANKKGLHPSYWINMGAMAITVLAGSHLLLAAPHSSFLMSVRPFLEGMTVILWAWGTWWIPLLAVISVYKCVVSKPRFQYHPAQWTVVFPLGMYTVASNELSEVPGLSMIHWLVPWWLWIAFAAWAIVGLEYALRPFLRNRHPSG